MIIQKILIFQQQMNFQNYNKHIWPRNLGLRTTESRPSRRASMSADDLSTQNHEICMSEVYKHIDNL